MIFFHVLGGIFKKLSAYLTEIFTTIIFGYLADLNILHQLIGNLIVSHSKGNNKDKLCIVE